MASNILRRQLSSRYRTIPQLRSAACTNTRVFSNRSILHQAEPLQSLTPKPTPPDPRSIESDVQDGFGGVRPEDVRQSGPSGSGVFKTHTVEDLHGMSASDILAESGRASHDTQMRHFTGMPFL